MRGEGREGGGALLRLASLKCKRGRLQSDAFQLLSFVLFFAPREREDLVREAVYFQAIPFYIHFAFDSETRNQHG